MRIHTDTLDLIDIRRACEGLPICTEIDSEHGSRKRKRAFEIQLSGSSTRLAQSGNWNAATWDEWGVFLGRLFALDPDMTSSYYVDADAFHKYTCDRFRDGTMPEDTHAQHKWVYDFANSNPWSGNRISYCNKCSAKTSQG